MVRFTLNTILTKQFCTKKISTESFLRQVVGHIVNSVSNTDLLLVSNRPLSMTTTMINNSLPVISSNPIEFHESLEHHLLQLKENVKNDVGLEEWF